MLNYIIRRLIYGFFTVLGVLGLLFFLFFALTSPDDIARRAVGDKAAQAVLDEWKAKHGYDKPRYINSDYEATNPKRYSETLLYSHYASMLGFNFGNSDFDDTSIMDRIGRGAGPSLCLTVPLFIQGMIIGIMISLLVAMFRASYIDKVVLVISVVTMSTPGILFVIGGQHFLGRILMWYPVSGFDPNPAYMFRFLAIPIIIGVVQSVGGGVRMNRTIFLNETGQDYIRTARAKGCGDFRIMIHHVLRNAMIPILTGVITAIPFLFTGSLLMESFFGIPGLGAITVDAIQNNDFSTLRAMVYIGALIFIVSNILTDISYTIVDPRVRLD